MTVIPETRRAHYIWYLCFHWHTPRNWQWGPVKNEILRENRWFQCSHVAIFQQHLIWIIHLSVDTIVKCYQNCLARRLLLTRNPSNQGYLVVKLKLSLGIFYNRYWDLVNCHRYLCHWWPQICSVYRSHNPTIFVLHDLSLVFLTRVWQEGHQTK
jgi:hypothetical protein